MLSRSLRIAQPSTHSGTGFTLRVWWSPLNPFLPQAAAAISQPPALLLRSRAPATYDHVIPVSLSSTAEALLLSPRSVCQGQHRALSLPIASPSASPLIPRSPSGWYSPGTLTLSGSSSDLASFPTSKSSTSAPSLSSSAPPTAFAISISISLVAWSSISGATSSSSISGASNAYFRQSFRNSFCRSFPSLLQPIILSVRLLHLPRATAGFTFNAAP
ncbi:hypothetical protein OPV22_001852 [Ensete ventricosum]|uniref:REJ domain-containing protein n=1 Tax=Ensete ventricosum TaxID=4639 RepID=A0AAV8RV98_ENSVE|nr:hypothetical protein OPV22_001852 [Ensete ventricosum]